MPVIGFSTAERPKRLPISSLLIARDFRELGYVEGVNVAMEYRWAHGEYARLPQLLADLI